MIKKYIRKLLLLLPINFSKNLQYDKLTKRIIRRVCTKNSNCIDVGSHKGEVLDIILQSAPNGYHLAFEPIPELAAELSTKYKHHKVNVMPYALSNYTGKSSFNLVVTNPAYSGLQKRNYDRAEKDKKIDINVACLDDLVDAQSKIALVKIDVEGGELDVIKGAVSLLERDHPVLIFEHGKGSAEHYASGPEQVFDALTELGYKVYTLVDFLAHGKSIHRYEFIQYFEDEREYYFVAN